jgi:hypothetical protein
VYAKIPHRDEAKRMIIGPRTRAEDGGSALPRYGEQANYTRSILVPASSHPLNEQDRSASLTPQNTSFKISL